ncbi:hypothetical protein TNCV_4476621 [Trichonephila clavipes]|nr:hypothetical protein TNCV_4476621 [Trichonephila clavipes]
MLLCFHLVRSTQCTCSSATRNPSCDKDEIMSMTLDGFGEVWLASAHFIQSTLAPANNIANLCTLFPGGDRRVCGGEAQLEHQKCPVGRKRHDSRRGQMREGRFKWSVPLHVTGWNFLNCAIPYHYMRETDGMDSSAI